MESFVRKPSYVNINESDKPCFVFPKEAENAGNVKTPNIESSVTHDEVLTKENSINKYAYGRIATQKTNGIYLLDSAAKSRENDYETLTPGQTPFIELPVRAAKFRSQDDEIKAPDRTPLIELPVKPAMSRSQDDEIKAPDRRTSFTELPVKTVTYRRHDDDASVLGRTPLYDLPVNMVKYREEDARTSGRRILYAIIAILVLLLIAATVSFTVLYVKLKSDFNAEKDSEFDAAIQRFKHKHDYDTIETLIKSLGNNVTAELSLLRGHAERADSDIQKNGQEIAQTNSSLSDVISLLNLTLQLQLHNISKQPGPRGPQGVANNSRCAYYNVSNTAATSDYFPSFSPWAPTESDLETNVAMFGGCTVDGWLESVFETHAITNQRVQYRCKCSGTVPNKTRRICYAHFFSCPRESGEVINSFRTSDHESSRRKSHTMFYFL